MTPVPRFERRIRFAAIWIGLGLLIQAVSLTVVHPLAFVAFLLIGCPLTIVGVLLFLNSLIAERSG